MEFDTPSKNNRPENNDSIDINCSWILRITVISLLIFILGICVAGKRKSTWPIITWSLFSSYSKRFQFPEEIISTTELRIYTKTGKSYVIRPEQLISVARSGLSKRLIANAFDDSNISVRNATRIYLVRRLRDYIPKGSNVEIIQGWKISYQVEPLALPPIRLEEPMSEVMVGSFYHRDLVKNDLND